MAVSTDQTATVRVKAGDPEFTVSIIGLTLAVSGHSFIGLILSVIALKESKAAGRYNLFALLGMILGIVLSVLTIVVLVGYGIILSTTGFFHFR